MLLMRVCTVQRVALCSIEGELALHVFILFMSWIYTIRYVTKITGAQWYERIVSGVDTR